MVLVLMLADDTHYHELLAWPMLPVDGHSTPPTYDAPSHAQGQAQPYGQTAADQEQASDGTSGLGHPDTTSTRPKLCVRSALSIACWGGCRAGVASAMPCWASPVQPVSSRRAAWMAAPMPPWTREGSLLTSVCVAAGLRRRLPQGLQHQTPGPAAGCNGALAGQGRHMYACGQEGEQTAVEHVPGRGLGGQAPAVNTAWLALRASCADAGRYWRCSRGP